MLEHVKVESIDYVPSWQMTPTGAVNQILRPGPFLFSFLVQVMVASSLQAFRDARRLPTIPEVPLEIFGAGKVTHDNGRAFLFCEPPSPLQHIAAQLDTLHANHLKGVIKELRFGGTKAPRADLIGVIH